MSTTGRTTASGTDVSDILARLDSLESQVGNPPSIHGLEHAPGGGDPIPTSAFTASPSFPVEPDTGVLVLPAGWSDVAPRRLDINDVGVLYLAPFDLAATSGAVTALSFNILDPASGGGAVNQLVTGDTSNFEGGTIGDWTEVLISGVGNCALSVVGAWSHGGTKSLRMTARAAGKMKAAIGGAGGALNNRRLISPTDTIDVKLFGHAATQGRSGCRIFIDWFTAGHAYISTSTASGAGSIADLTTGTGVLAQATFSGAAIPATAASARIGWEISSTSTGAGEAHDIDDITVTQTTAGGASGARFRLALWKAAANGRTPASLVPLATTGIIDATIGGERNVLLSSPYNPAGGAPRVLLGRVYQQDAVPGTYPQIVECTALAYAPLTGTGIPANGAPRALTESGVNGSLSAHVVVANGTSPRVPFVGLATDATTPPSTPGQIRLGASKAPGASLVATQQALTDELGWTPSCTRLYQGWAASTTFPTADQLGYINLNYGGRHGRTMFLTISLTPDWDEIRAGGHDAEVVRWAGKFATAQAAAAALGCDFYVTWQHEIDVNLQVGKTAADYVATWQYLVNKCRPLCPGVKWLWNVTAYGLRQNKAQPFWPGDDWVDAIGADGYNPAGVWSGGPWTPWATIYQGLTAFSALHVTNGHTGKTIEIVVPECGCPPDPNGDLNLRPAWYQDMLVNLRTWPRCTAVIPWDNHDNAHPRKADNTFDLTKYLHPEADWTMERLVALTPATYPNPTQDLATIAAMVAIEADPIFT